jgi:hypothetical protein
MRAVRRALTAVQHVHTVEALRATIVQSVMDVSHAPALVFWLEEREPECGFWFESTEGPAASAFVGTYEGPGVMAHIPRRQVLDGPVFENLADSPSDIHRRNAVRLNAGSYRAVPVQPDGSDRSIRIGWASRDVGEYPALQQEALSMIADLARWTLTRMSADRGR